MCQRVLLSPASPHPGGPLTPAHTYQSVTASQLSMKPLEWGWGGWGYERIEVTPPELESHLPPAASTTRVPERVLDWRQEGLISSPAPCLCHSPLA